MFDSVPKGQDLAPGQATTIVFFDAPRNGWRFELATVHQLENFKQSFATISQFGPWERKMAPFWGTSYTNVDILQVYKPQPYAFQTVDMLDSYVELATRHKTIPQNGQDMTNIKRMGYPLVI